jgi:hypothetical protein
MPATSRRRAFIQESPGNRASAVFTVGSPDHRVDPESLVLLAYSLTCDDTGSSKMNSVFLLSLRKTTHASREWIVPAILRRFARFEQVGSAESVMFTK